MKITDVEVTSHKHDVKDPLVGDTKKNSKVYIKIETDEGIIGKCITSGSVGDRDYIKNKLVPLIMGEDPLDSEGIWTTIFSGLKTHWVTGNFQNRGVGIVDCALWDIKGKYLNQPVWRLLGGAKKKIPIYLSIAGGPPFYESTSEQFAEYATKYKKDGWTGFKLALGRGWRWSASRTGDYTRTEDDIVDKVRAVREAVGDNFKLMVDANTELSLIEAIRFAKRFEPYDLSWFEEPVYMNDPRSLALMKHHTSIPIAAGQHIGSKMSFRELLVTGNVDIVQPDVQNCAGFTEGVKIGHLAQAFNLPFTTHALPLVNMHLIAGLSNGLTIEWHHTVWNDNKNVYKNNPQPENGWMTLPDGPGLGLTPNEKVLEENLVP
jgi:L-alanine-DL-glutamate epimerase-like enolase superfamily enzyme